MPYRKELEEYTAEFFQKHWVSDAGKPPSWKIGWPWHGSVPYHDKGGVYALFSESGEVLYIGLGTSKGGGLYNEHGISRRLLSHVIQKDSDKGRGHYMPKKKWNDVKDIGAVGFPSEYSYLAAALEDFLIRKMSPPRNSVRKL